MKSRHGLRLLAVCSLCTLIVFGAVGCICMLPHLFGHGSDTHSNKAGLDAETNNAGHGQHVHEPEAGN